MSAVRRILQSVLLSFCVVVLLFASPVFAQNTINVPGDQATIQGAINVANNGDTVLVAPGTYYENINFNGKAITVTSSGGAAATIIDGSALDSVVFFDSGEGLESVLNGFTVQNGAPAGKGRGSGIYISSASPTITNNTIQNNTACGGAGIYSDAGGPKIQGNLVQNNVQPTVCLGAYGGGGIFLLSANFAQIIGNVITDNIEPAGSGGGLGMNGPNGVTVTGNVIADNQSENQGGGIWIINLVSATITQNLIYGNSSGSGNTSGQGAGLYLSIPASSSGVTVVNNTIANNPLMTTASQGSAVYVSGFASQSQVSNNLLIGYPGQDAVYCAFSVSVPILMSNDTYTTNGNGFDGTCMGQAGKNGNFSVDPLFVNTGAADFHLQPTSPAIDAGTNAAPNLPQTDLAGNPRILDGNNDCVSTVDMGAYELVRSANAGFSTSILNFGSQVLNTSSSPRAVALSNTGTTCFQFSSIGITGDFSQGNTCSAAGVRGGTSCQFNVTFTPTALGTRLGALTVSGTDGITSLSPSVSLSGVGADFSVAASPTSASVKHGQSVKFTIKVNPLGGSFSSAVALSCSGLPSKAACSFSPASVTPGETGATSAMTITTSGNTPRGNYNILVVGRSGTDTHSTTVLLSVD